MGTATDRSMWTCPDCGRSFANTNQAHACQTTSVDDYLAGKTDLAISIFEGVVAILEESGDFRIHAQKTRIGFISRMTFGGVKLARKWVDLSFILPTALDDDRVRRLELYGPTSWGHTIRLSSVDDIDDDVGRWLSEALRRGDQETLDPNAEVVPLAGRQLDVFWTGFRGKVANSRIRLPGHVSEALALADHVTLRVMGMDYPTKLKRSAGSTYVDVDVGSGLGEGETTDVFFKAGD